MAWFLSFFPTMIFCFFWLWARALNAWMDSYEAWFRLPSLSKSPPAAVGFRLSVPRVSSKFWSFFFASFDRK